jgi:hypothetical protein
LYDRGGNTLMDTETNKSNPYGANSSTPDPREQVCWDFYVQSVTIGQPNAYESAIKAGYQEASARQITVRSWFLERNSKLKRKGMFSKAERNLDKALDTEYTTPEGQIKSDVMKIVIDVSKVIVSTLGKDEGYATRSELTSKDGKELFNTLTDEEKEKLNSLL